MKKNKLFQTVKDTFSSANKKIIKSQCNICGNDLFGAGPGGRMSITGTPPRCKKCQSLERHRIYRKIFEQLRDDQFKSLSFLQFSPDKTVDPDWFASYEVSIYGGDNSLDLQKIDRKSYQYDIVMCNHVLEHVKYDNSALNELLRITKKDGFVFLTVPSPLHQVTTNDWGHPKGEQHGHYRIYGKDFIEQLKQYLPYAWIASITGKDNVTDTDDIVFFLCHSQQGIKAIFDRFTETVLIQQGLYKS
jgi:SAM-dependent methyltransferase